MPMLQVSVNWLPSMRVAAAGDVEHARAAAASAPRWSEPCTSNANWSPPRRASRSPCRRQVLMRSPTSISTRSPTSLPRLSLICLKRSRSSSSSAKPAPSRRAMCQRQLQRVTQVPAVGQPGQRIGGDQRLDAPVGPDQLGAVAKRPHAPDRAPAAHLRLRHHLQRGARQQLQRRVVAHQRRFLQRCQLALVAAAIADAAAHPIEHRVVARPVNSLSADPRSPRSVG